MKKPADPNATIWAKIDRLPLGFTGTMAFYPKDQKPPPDAEAPALDDD
ncbi:MAG TPA: hypothetical protein VII95_14395 [Terriglobales bacterium]